MLRLSDEEMAIYPRPSLETGESRRPTLTWPREIPIKGEPANVAQWLSTSEVPKLFMNADPGSILTAVQREFCRTWPKQGEVTVKGTYFLQEDSPLRLPKPPAMAHVLALSCHFRSLAVEGLHAGQLIRTHPLLSQLGQAGSVLAQGTDQSHETPWQAIQHLRNFRIVSTRTPTSRAI